MDDSLHEVLEEFELATLEHESVEEMVKLGSEFRLVRLVFSRKNGFNEADSDLVKKLFFLVFFTSISWQFMPLANSSYLHKHLIE